tara:strand:- start:5776 stop:6534 length:759 start_codon:yes stop_codon:yes gene_type:complete
MIAVTEVVSRLDSVLDAESSDRYTFNQDFKQAINYAVEWIQSVLNRAYSENKLTEENLGELTRVSVFQTNAYSRFKMDPTQMGHSVWSILAVLPEITTIPANATIIALADASESIYRTNVSFEKSNFSAKRLTSEEWEENNQNPFVAGNTILNNGLKKYGYLNNTIYTSSNYLESTPQIEVRPSQVRQFVAVRYLIYPNLIAGINDVIPFPKTLTNLVVMKANNFISMKQGDNTNLYSVSAEDVSTLTKIIL